MCYTDCFLFYFTIRAGSTCASTMLLTLGVIGCIAVPLLPFSENPMQFMIVMGYMILLVIAFTTTLCGSFTDSKTSVGLGLVLGILAFILWLTLTIPSLLAYHKKSVNEFCLGQNCGESHWLVPRHWDDEMYADFPAPTKKSPSMRSRGQQIEENAPRENYQPKGMKSIIPGLQIIPKTVEMATKSSNIDEYMDNTFGNDTVSDNDSGKWVELAQNMLGNNNATEIVLRGRRDLMGGENRFPDGRFLQSKDSFLPLSKTWSVVLAFLYGLLHICVLTTIFMYLSSFTCKEGPCCPGLEEMEKPPEEKECWAPKIYSS